MTINLENTDQVEILVGIEVRAKSKIKKKNPSNQLKA